MPEELAHVFEPFYQVDGSHARQGFGLGLAIVKKIASLHGWHVDVTQLGRRRARTFVVRFTAVPLKSERLLNLSLSTHIYSRS